MRHGERKKLHNYFNKFFLFLRLKGKKSIVSYLKFIFYRLSASILLKIQRHGRRSVKSFFGWHYFSKVLKKKYVTQSVSWLKKSVIMRREKTLMLRLYSEFENIKQNKGQTILQKKNFYLSFKQTKGYRYLAKYIRNRF